MTLGCKEKRNKETKNERIGMKEEGSKEGFKGRNEI